MGDFFIFFCRIFQRNPNWPKTSCGCKLLVVQLFGKILTCNRSHKLFNKILILVFMFAPTANQSPAWSTSPHQCTVEVLKMKM